MRTIRNIPNSIICGHMIMIDLNAMTLKCWWLVKRKFIWVICFGSRIYDSKKILCQFMSQELDLKY